MNECIIMAYAHYSHVNCLAQVEADTVTPKVY